MIRKLTQAVGAGILMIIMLFNACTEETPEADCTTSDLAVAISNARDSDCNGSNGAFTANGTGGDGSYTFSIDGSGFQESGTFEGLSSGSYTVTVKDGNECTATATVNISDRVDVTMTIASTEAGCGENNGSITVTADGEGTFTYSINDGSFQENGVFENLSRGIYIVRARDENGCSVAESVEVSSGLSLSADIKPIIEANCAVSGCHVAGNDLGLPNYNNNSTIISLASNIKARTQAGQMPPPSSGRSLTDAEIERIACWVDDGAPNN